MKIFQKQISPWILYILIVVGVLFCLAALWNVSSTSALGSGDFIGYWSATHLIAHGENPYSLERMGEVQRSIPTGLDATIMAWNPPLLFVFLLPFGFLSFSIAKFLWLAVNITIYLAAGVMLVQLYLSESSLVTRILFLLFVVCLPQAISGIFMGQVTFLVYFGLTLGLVLLSKERFFLAGMSLVLTLVKPHLVILALIYLFVLMARKRRFTFWYGLVFSGILCALILFIFRPAWIHDLIGETKISPVNWITPTVGGLMSYLGVSEIFRSVIFLLLPLPIYLAWFSPELDIKQTTAFLTLLTVPLTFFGWSYDQVILLLPIAQVFAWISRPENKPAKIWFASFMALSILAIIIQRIYTRNDLYQLWFPFFIWVIYYLARRHQISQPIPTQHK